jgi:hypothetical protein
MSTTATAEPEKPPGAGVPEVTSDEENITSSENPKFTGL